MKTILGFIGKSELKNYGKTPEDAITILPNKFDKDDIFVEVEIKEITKSVSKRLKIQKGGK